MDFETGPKRCHSDKNVDSFTKNMKNIRKLKPIHNFYDLPLKYYFLFQNIKRFYKNFFNF